MVVVVKEDEDNVPGLVKIFEKYLKPREAL